MDLSDGGNLMKEAEWLLMILLSGNGNDGNLTNGPTWVSGKIGGALSFDGVDDFVFLGNPPEIGRFNSGNQSIFPCG